MQKTICVGIRKNIEAQCIAVLGLWAVHRDVNKGGQGYTVTHISSGLYSMSGLQKNSAMALLFELQAWEEDLCDLKHNTKEWNDFISSARGTLLQETIKGYTNYVDLR